MTDEEIIKAWDILCKMDFFEGQRAGRELWNDKPFDVQNKDIEDFVKDLSFLKDFINRLQEQNAALIAGQETLQKHIAEKDAEIEALQDEVVIKTNMYNDMKSQRDKEHHYCMHYMAVIAKAKSEAIKEFAERLKKQFKIQSHYQTTTIIACAHFKDAIDNLVEEMVGETDV